MRDTSASSILIVSRFKRNQMTHWLIMLICALFASASARGEATRCPHANMVIHSADREENNAACETANNALDFLAAQGLDTTASVEIHLSTALPPPCSENSFGCYDHPKRRINMLVMSECLMRREWAEVPVSRALCHSFLAHEVGHAVAAANFLIPAPSVMAQEYLAYVTMFSTIPQRDREQLLSRLPGQGFDSTTQMSLIYYLLNPSRFGAEVYRHFLKLVDGRVFFKEILMGRTLNQD